MWGCADALKFRFFLSLTTLLFARIDNQWGETEKDRELFHACDQISPLTTGFENRRVRLRRFSLCVSGHEFYSSENEESRRMGENIAPSGGVGALAAQLRFFKQHAFPW